ncbi:tetratricopeptide repeat protein [Nocardia sp. alder85J]|uniref:tetratricopeptide repeat protein n=1 Tax=Nocardia sp. alder85J TaxID=2862949 RepID=UPI001CD21999|nr:tetratricopeptide repeat protein [Nocardia sp. alder85J]MCX4098566.1 tetratricopeptide repeat protein [Nocardia sp. alder85J]
MFESVPPIAAVGHSAVDASVLELRAVGGFSETDARDGASAVLDLEFHNTGSRSVLLHRATVRVHRAAEVAPARMVGFLPYEEWLIERHLRAGREYDVGLPVTACAAGARRSVTLAEVVAPGAAGRLPIRLVAAEEHARVTLAYLLEIDVAYDAGRTLTTPRIAIAIAPGTELADPDDIRADLATFRAAVRAVRDAVDRELALRGLAAPDWDHRPPACRADLPAHLRALDGDPGDLLNLGPGVYEVNDAFWDPAASLARRLDDIRAYCTDLVEFIAGADIRHDSLSRILAQAHHILARLPALRAELEESEGAVAVRHSAPAGELAQLLGEDPLTELRARAAAGEPEAARRLDLAARLADTIRSRGPDHPETLLARETPILWRLQAGDMAGAAVALAELIPDQVRVFGPDHPRTLRARHLLAKCLGETGDVDAARTAFAALVDDRARILGPDHPDTLDSRHESARWRVMAGDTAGAVATFAALVADRTRIQGPDHPDTLYARHNLAVCRGRAGDVATAVTDLVTLVADWTRLRGDDDAETRYSRGELARWQVRAGAVHRRRGVGGPPPGW